MNSEEAIVCTRLNNAAFSPGRLDCQALGMILVRARARCGPETVSAALPCKRLAQRSNTMPLASHLGRSDVELCSGRRGGLQAGRNYKKIEQRAADQERTTANTPHYYLLYTNDRRTFTAKDCALYVPIKEECECSGRNLSLN